MECVSEEHWAVNLCIPHKLCSLSSYRALNFQRGVLCNPVQMSAQVRGELQKGNDCFSCASCGIIKAIFYQVKLL